MSSPAAGDPPSSKEMTMMMMEDNNNMLIPEFCFLKVSIAGSAIEDPIVIQLYRRKECPKTYYYVGTLWPCVRHRKPPLENHHALVVIEAVTFIESIIDGVIWSNRVILNALMERVDTPVH
jgi:hypothetical protein